MAIFVAILAMFIGWYALVRARQAHDALQTLQREFSRMNARQNQAKDAQEESGGAARPAPAGANVRPAPGGTMEQA